MSTMPQSTKLKIIEKLCYTFLYSVNPISHGGTLEASHTENNNYVLFCIEHMIILFAKLSKAQAPALLSFNLILSHQATHLTGKVLPSLLECFSPPKLSVPATID